MEVSLAHDNGVTAQLFNCNYVIYGSEEGSIPKKKKKATKKTESLTEIWCMRLEKLQFK